MRRPSKNACSAALLGMWVGLAGIGCDGARAQSSVGIAVQLTDAGAPPNRVLPAADAPIAGPSAWRELRFGMSEQEAQRVMAGYQTKTGPRWQRATRPILPTVRLSEDAVDSTPVDSARFHEWTLTDLDDGAGELRLWHQEGALVAMEVTGKVPMDVFVRKAAETYGGAPRRVRLRFGDGATGTAEFREAAIWPGADATALVWTSRSLVPTLLLWSNGAMARRAAEYQSSLDAPSHAAKLAAEASERATRF